MKQNKNLHNGKPESSDLFSWVEWAENIDEENEGCTWDFPLVSVEYVMELYQQVAEMKIDGEDFCRLLKEPVKDKEDRNEM